MSRQGDPKPKSYAPFVSARYPAAGSPPKRPKWRVLVHRKHVERWNKIAEVCGERNAGEIWEHLTTQPDKPPLLGTVTPMKGRQYGKQEDGTSRVLHYEVSGAGRVDYRYNPKTIATKGDEHPVVWIVSIDFGSH